MAELLLELFSEEIPARMQARAAEDLRRLVLAKLAAAQLQHDRADVFVTARRLTLVIDGLPAAQPDVAEERRGPRVGAPDQAVQGFLKSAGLASLDGCEQRDTGKGIFWFAMIRKAGRPTSAVLPELLREAALELPWPKSQRFPAAPFRWVRPLTRVLCLFDGAVLPLDLGAVPTADVASGHRFLAPADFKVRDFADYAEKLRAAYVMLDPEERRRKIAADLALAAKGAGLAVKDDPALLDEVTGLVEFPVVLTGAIDRHFMDVPPEVLTTSMRAHQKYFACLDAHGKLAATFLVVSNNLTADGGKTIVAGNERVLRARLSDAQFFWDQDRKVHLESRVEKLGERIFHAKLGSVLDKVRRIAALVEVLVPYVPGADAALARRAALLAKADLSSGMVGEFPELQGVMGRYYALHDGEPIEIADAVAEHYSPLGPNDRCPTAPTSVVVALADKIDTLVGFFAIDEKPTGSKDPYALRRAALGVIRLIIENKLRLPLAAVFATAFADLSRTVVLKAPSPERSLAENRRLLSLGICEALLDFFADRLKVHLREQGVRHDLIAAVFAPRPATSPPLPLAGEGRVRGEAGEGSAAQAQAASNPHPDPLPHAGEGGGNALGEVEDDLVRLLARVAALKEFLDSEDGSNLLVAYRRASNIVRIEEKKDGATYDAEPDPKLLQQAEESAVAERLSEVGRLSDAALHKEEFGVAMQALAKLRRPVDEFFSAVTVNCEDVRLRANRLRLLSRIRATLSRVADFSQIEG